MPKISQLPPLTVPTRTDLIPLVDSATGTTKYIQMMYALTGATKIVAPVGYKGYADYYTDGIHDESEISSAILAVYNTGGGTVVLQPGQTFNINAFIRHYPTVTLIAYGATINLIASAGSMIQDAYHAGILNSVNHIGLRRGIWNGGCNVTGKIILLAGAALDIRDLEISSSTGAFAIHVHNASDFIIQNIFLNNVASDGIHLSGPILNGTIRNIHGHIGNMAYNTNAARSCGIGPVGYNGINWYNSLSGLTF